MQKSNICRNKPSTKKGRTKAGLKLWIATETGCVLFGEGRKRLLEAIEKYGSLSQAAKKLAISYRKAWGDLKKTEERLGFHIINRTRGGSGGGFSGLTDEGIELLNSYREFKKEAEKAVQKSFSKRFGKMLSFIQ